MNKGKENIMKSTGIVRKVDRLGRVVLPMSIRTRLGIQEDDPVEIYVDGEQSLLSFHSTTSCSFPQKTHAGWYFCKIICSPST